MIACRVEDMRCLILIMWVDLAVKEAGGKGCERAEVGWLRHNDDDDSIKGRSPVGIQNTHEIVQELISWDCSLWG